MAAVQTRDIGEETLDLLRRLIALQSVNDLTPDSGNEEAAANLFESFFDGAIIGTAGALGDAGSPASDSTLGPTAGLNVDGQHDHMRDTVIPTFLHYNVPLLIGGWVAAMVL